MKIECPICQGRIRHIRSVDRFHVHEIDAEGNVTEIEDKDNTHGTIYCVNDSDHELSTELLDKVVGLVFKLDESLWEKGED